MYILHIDDSNLGTSIWAINSFLAQYSWNIWELLFEIVMLWKKRISLPSDHEITNAVRRFLSYIHYTLKPIYKYKIFELYTLHSKTYNTSTKFLHYTLKPMIQVQNFWAIYTIH